MTLNDLIPELLKLNRDETVQAIDVLQRHLTETPGNEQGQIVEGAVYEVWSPTITPETAGILQEVLKAAKEKYG